MARFSPNRKWKETEIKHEFYGENIKAPPMGAYFDNKSM
jgi:hypothetical protein